jgi:hypothetical protein
MFDDSETRHAFRDIFNGVSEYHQKPKMTTVALSIYWESLKQYSLEQVRMAITRHLRDPEQGSYYPKVSDIVGHIEGAKPEPSEVVAMARAAKCPFGIFARIKIGTHDLNRGDHFYLIDRANEVLVDFENFKARATSGEYTDHEISIMLKHSVNPCDSFLPGISPPPSNVRALISKRSEQVQETPRHKILLEDQSHDENDKSATVHPDISKRLALIVGGRS